MIANITERLQGMRKGLSKCVWFSYTVLIRLYGSTHLFHTRFSILCITEVRQGMSYMPSLLNVAMRRVGSVDRNINQPIIRLNKESSYHL